MPLLFFTASLNRVAAELCTECDGNPTKFSSAASQTQTPGAQTSAAATRIPHSSGKAFLAYNVGEEQTPLCLAASNSDMLMKPSASSSMLANSWAELSSNGAEVEDEPL